MQKPLASPKFAPKWRCVRALSAPIEATNHNIQDHVQLIRMHCQSVAFLAPSPPPPPPPPG